MWCNATNTASSWASMFPNIITEMKWDDPKTICRQFREAIRSRNGMLEALLTTHIKVRCSIGFESTAPFPLSQSFSPAIFLAICESDHPHLIDALQPVIKNMSGRKADTCCSRGPTARTPCLRCQHARAPARSLVPVPYLPPRKPAANVGKSLQPQHASDSVISLKLWWDGNHACFPLSTPSCLHSHFGSKFGHEEKVLLTQKCLADGGNRI